MTVPDIDALFAAHEKIHTKTDPGQPQGLKPLPDDVRERLQTTLRNAEDTIVIATKDGSHDPDSAS